MRRMTWERPPLPARWPAPPACEAPAPQHPLRRLSSRDLVGNEGQVEIEHEGAVYRLRVTSLGKLILTK